MALGRFIPENPDEDQVLRFEYEKGVKKVFPAHFFVKHWLFTEVEQAEAPLANSVACVARKNGLSANDIQHLFPAILRMLKSDIPWAGQKQPITDKTETK